MRRQLVVEHEIAELTFRDGIYRTRVRRQLRNTGAQPVTQYLIRIAVDRYPGDPERSNELYRHDPLTWDEISLEATCGDEPMTWRVKHDRDALKEVWLLFENQRRQVPVVPGRDRLDRLRVQREPSASGVSGGLALSGCRPAGSA